MKIQNIALLLIVLMSCMNVAVAHSPEEFVKVDYATSQQFAASMPAATYQFYMDGSLKQDSASNTYTTSWTASGQHNVTVVASTGESYTWFPWVYRELADASDSTEKLEHAFDDLEAGVENDDYSRFIDGIGSPYIAVMGGMYYLIVLGMPFFMIFRRQENLLIPSIVGLISGAVLLGMMPEDYKLYLQAGILMSATATMWTLYRER